MSRRVACLALIPVLYTACGESSTPAIDASTVDADSSTPDAGTAPELGTVTVVDIAATTCPNGNGSLSGTQCIELGVLVTAASAVPKRVWLRHTRTTADIVRGTVVFGTGGAGASWYNERMTGMVLDAGFDVVVRRWDGSLGWLEAEGGMRAAAGRYATLVTWIHENLHGAAGAYCATGNSAGATEVSYAMARWGRGAIIDLIVPTGGPPMGRVDVGCMAPDSAEGMACRTRELPSGHDCPILGCAYGPRQVSDRIDSVYSGSPCADGDFDTLLADSIASPDAVLSYPQSAVRFVYGAGDCGAGPGLGYYYYDALVSAGADVDLAIAPGTPHGTSSTVAGRAAILAAIDTDCVVRH